MSGAASDPARTFPIMGADDDVTQMRDRYADGQRDNNAARMHGLIAVLALPAVRCADGAMRRVPVEVQIGLHEWVLVEDLAIDADGMTFSFGTNGKRVEYRFDGDRCPEWRVRQSTRVRVFVVDS